MQRAVITLDDVARLATELPAVSEGQRWGHRTWVVNGKAFAWERPFSKADIKRFGDEVAPSGSIIAVAVADLSEKDAVLASSGPAFFTISHFDGYPAVLVSLATVRRADLKNALIDAWLSNAPDDVAEQYLRR